MIISVYISFLFAFHLYNLEVVTSDLKIIFSNLTFEEKVIYNDVVFFKYLFQEKRK